MKQNKEQLRCSWREACEAADYALTHFGSQRDRGIWVWYCRRVGLERFLDLADTIASCKRQGELRFPERAFQHHLQEMLPRGGAQ